MATITYSQERSELARSFGSIPARKVDCSPRFVAKTINASYAELETFSQGTRELWSKYSTTHAAFTLAA